MSLRLKLPPAGWIFVVAALSGTVLQGAGPSYYFTTLAGSTTAGSADGVGAVARFNQPNALVVDDDGSVFVADTQNRTIRRIKPDGTVITLAGLAGVADNLDGVGSQARFLLPTGLAWDADGNLAVIDQSHLVRRVTLGGAVSTLAGNLTSGPPADGQGAAVRFYNLSASAITLAPDGNLRVAEASYYSTGFPSYYWWGRLRQITPAGVVTTDHALDALILPHTTLTGLAYDGAGTLYACDLEYGRLCKVNAGGAQELVFPSGDFYAPQNVAAAPDGQVYLTDGSRVGRLDADGNLEILGGSAQSGYQDGLGSVARFQGIRGLAAGEDGAIYLSCLDNTIRKGVPATAPVITVQPRSRTVPAGSSVQFSVTVTAVPDPVYQWYHAGSPISGATAASYAIAAATVLDSGDYAVSVTNALGSVMSAPATLTLGSGPTGAGNGGTGGAAPAGAGGGAPSPWFAVALAVLAAVRWRQHCSAGRIQ